MSNLAYHPKGLKVKEGPFRPGTNHPSSDVTTSDFRELPLEFTIVHPGSVRGGAGGATRHEVSHKGRGMRFPAETQRRRGKRRERILGMGGGFILGPAAVPGRGTRDARGRGRVLRWGGNAGVG